MDGWRNWRGDELLKAINRSLRESIQDTLETVLTESRGEVPLDEGTLEHSGKVVMASGTKASGAVCYGGGTGTGFPLVPYAIRWHQKQANFQHGRKRFYLRDPFYRVALREFENNISRRFNLL